MRARHSPKFAAISTIVVTKPGNPHYWDVFATIVAGFPSLSAQGIGGYNFVAPNYTGSLSPVSTPIGVFAGLFNIPLLSKDNSSESLEKAFSTLYNTAIAPYPGEFTVILNATNYTDFWAWYKDNNGPLDAGYDALLVSRLLTPKHLQDKEGTKEAFKSFIPPRSGSVATLHLVSGKGVWEAKPRGGGNSVNPSWRKALVHASKSSVSNFLLHFRYQSKKGSLTNDFQLLHYHLTL
jgi:hypothetical protein